MSWSAWMAAMAADIGLMRSIENCKRISKSKRDPRVPSKKWWNSSRNNTEQSKRRFEVWRKRITVTVSEVLSFIR